MGGAELQLVGEAFASNYIAPLGPMVDAFEREFADYTGIPHCLALVSGTAAMHLALRELGVGPGDEVLASSLTFIGSVTPVTFLGATLVFLDSDRATWNLDPALLAEELAACAQRGKLPKAVIPTDLYGQCADLHAIQGICGTYGIPVVADAAEAMGARYWNKAESRKRKPEIGSNSSVGVPPAFPTPASSLVVPSAPPSGQSIIPSAAVPESVGNPHSALLHHAGFGAKASIFSFNGNKIITTSGGGMLASDDKELIEHARKLSQQARDPAPHYEHTEIGYNYRMSNIVAAIGRGQLRVLDQRVERKRLIFAAYQQLLGDLPGIEFMPEAPTGRCNRWLTVILIEPEQFGATNEQVRLALEAENIESRPVWKPMHMQPVFRGCRMRGGQVSEHFFAHGLCLPSGTAMSDSDLERVAAVVRGCRRAKKQKS
jgi:dTDP-4-amino-4,6-dideoxygalactose transaminase